jgi:hypothetical protein
MRSTPTRASPLLAIRAQRAAILARQANDLCIEIAAAGVLDAFDQNRPASFEDVVSIETYPRRCMAMSPAELRHLSRVLLAHAGRVRADADASRLRSIKCRHKANVARASAAR